MMILSTRFKLFVVSVPLFYCPFLALGASDDGAYDFSSILESEILTAPEDVTPQDDLEKPSQENQVQLVLSHLPALSKDGISQKNAAIIDSRKNLKYNLERSNVNGKNFFPVEDGLSAKALRNKLVRYLDPQDIKTGDYIAVKLGDKTTYGPITDIWEYAVRYTDVFTQSSKDVLKKNMPKVGKILFAYFDSTKNRLLAAGMDISNNSTGRLEKIQGVYWMDGKLMVLTFRKDSYSRIWASYSPDDIEVNE